MRVVLLTGAGVLLASPAMYYLLVARGSAAPAPAVAADTSPSVAVLPFVNISDDPANESFSDGLSEEILNALAGIPGLRVPARTSSFAFKGQAQDVAKIGAALRVKNLLEGSVRKSGGRVRITAQLVSAADGYHLWSQTYDRSLSDVFAIQDEIAKEIATALKVRLVSEARGGGTRAFATAVPEAYEAYLAGRHAINQRTRSSIEAAAASFRRATALDPAYAPAYADLAIATLFLARSEVTYGDVPLSEAMTRARPALDKALAIAPDHVEALAAAGLMDSLAGRYRRALELYDRSLAVNPSNAEVHNWRAMALGALGRYDQILAAATEAVRVDPLSKIAWFNYAPMLQVFGRTAEAASAAEQLRSLDEGWGEWVLGVLSNDRGDRPEAARHLLKAQQLGRDKARASLARVFAELGLREEALRAAGPGDPAVLCMLGDRAAALEAARGAASADPDDPGAAILLFEALYGAGRSAEAAALAARLWEREVAAAFKPELLLAMADAARTAGDAARAARYRNRAQEVLELERRAGLAAEHVDVQRAVLAIYDGREREGVALLVANLSTFSGPRSNLDLPLARAMAGRADFQAAVRAIDATFADQRGRVVRMLCGPDRVSASWEPAPQTCAKVSMAP
jgi:TolB-like protein/Tfp pilus assembly protein PilF